MCISCVWYPLVGLENGKKKILMHFPIQGGTRDELQNLHEYERQFQKGVYLRSDYKHINGVFKKEGVVSYEKMVQIPCGKCSECLKSQARGWALRILKEAELHEDNFFITLTYNDESIPHDHMLVKDEISKFNKALKVYLERRGLDSHFRFYGVGEYGGQTARPHYHVIYFGLPIPDLKYEYTTENGDLIFSSLFLDSVWKKGFVVIGSVDVASACYVARYCDKKKLLTKEEKDKLKDKGIVPEFNVMSRRPGIGADYLNKVIDNVVSGCYNVNMKGNTFGIPLYYSKKMKELLPPEVLHEYESRSKQSVLNHLCSDLLSHDSLVEYYEAINVQKLNDKNARKL